MLCRKGKNVVNEDQPPPTKKCKYLKTKLFSYLEAEGSSSNGKDDDEVDHYMHLPCLKMKANPLEFWLKEAQTYQFLSKIAESTLGIPASSAAAERLFSIAGKVYCPERCHLSDNKFEQLMFIRPNISNFINKVISFLFILNYVIFNVLSQIK